MKPAPFQYIRASSIEDAVSALAEDGETRVLAGGQSLIAMMNLRLVKPERLIDINRLSMLDYLRLEDGVLEIGALTRHETIKASPLVAEYCPLLAEAYRFVAHKAVRNRGTIGGNLCHADPASETPAVAIAVGATLLLRSAGGERSVDAEDFFLGLYETATRPDELLTEIRIPSRVVGEGWAFAEVSPRQGDFAIVAIAATLGLEDGKAASAGLVCAGVGDRARRIEAAEQAIIGSRVDEGSIDAAAAAARAAVDPQGDFHADPEYRRDLVATLTRRALGQAHARCS